MFNIQVERIHLQLIGNSNRDIDVLVAVGVYMRVLVLSSGGKDSTLAAWWALSRGWDVAGMVTVGVRNDDSYMFQIQSTNIAALQSAAMRVGWAHIEVSGNPESEVDELEVELVEIIIGKSGPKIPKEVLSFSGETNANINNIDSGGPIDAIVCGAIRSEYQRRRIELMCERLGVKSFTPLWHNDPLKHMEELVACGFNMILVSVSADGLGEEWLGEEITVEKLEILKTLAKKYRFSVDGEGGEYETIVLSAPHFNNQIEVEGRSIWLGRRGEFVIDRARLGSN